MTIARIRFYWQGETLEAELGDDCTWSCVNEFVERGLNLLYGPPAERHLGRPGDRQLAAAEAALGATRTFFLAPREAPGRVY